MANHRPGDILYMYSSAQYAFRYYSNRYGFKEGDYIIATWSRDNWKKYDEDMDKLSGNKRVWVLFSHIWNGSGVNEEKYFLNHLNSMGKRLDALKKTGASVYLYDLSKPPATNQAQPGIEPTS